MRNLYLLLFLTITALSSSAQTKTDTSAHLTFKGIPLDGTINQYVAKMQQNGFKHISTNDGVAMLIGDFAGYKGCYVGVSTLEQKDLVYKVIVLFPEKETWSSLSGNYFDLKEMLTEKYGKPSFVIEKFDTRTEPKDDSNKMHEVKFDRCKYYSIWKIDKGDIELSIDHDGVTSCFVRLAYFDKINGAVIKKQALDDL